MLCYLQLSVIRERARFGPFGEPGFGQLVRLRLCDELRALQEQRDDAREQSARRRGLSSDPGGGDGRFPSSHDTKINLIDDGATCTFDYLLLLISAGFMAAVGLGSNSSVVTVASMLVSPLMGPILGIAFGTPTGSLPHSRRRPRRRATAQVAALGNRRHPRLCRPRHPLRASSSAASSSVSSAPRSASSTAETSGPAGPPTKWSTAGTPSTSSSASSSHSPRESASRWLSPAETPPVSWESPSPPRCCLRA